MSKRAAFRREKKQADKVAKLSGPQREVQDLYIRARDDGRSLTYVCTLSCLIEHFGFGKKRVERINSRIREESAKVDRDGMMFVLRHLIDKVHAALDSADYLVEPEDFKDHMYLCQRDSSFSVAMAVMLDVLSEEFGFSFMANGKGRLDYCLQWAVSKYARYTQDHSSYIREKTRIEKKLEVRIS